MLKKVCKSVGLFLASFALALFIPEFVISPSLRSISEIASIQTSTTPNSSTVISRELAFKLLRSTVRVSRGSASGSGVIIASREYKGVVFSYIITNYHNILTEESVNVETFSYLKNKTISATQIYRGKVIAKNPLIDLAILEVTHSSSIGPVSKFASYEELEDLALYDPLFVCGCGLGKPPYITEGHLSMVSDTYYFGTAFTIFGNSGGGLYTKRGNLLGIAKLITIMRVQLGGKDLMLPEPNLPIFIPGHIVVEWINDSGHGYIWDAKEFNKIMQNNEAAIRKKFY